MFGIVIFMGSVLEATSLIKFRLVNIVPTILPRRDSR